VLPPSASQEEKKEIFLKFLEEGVTSFKKYQVLYLKGISKPTRYEDLLKPEKITNYSDVNWKGSRPSNNNFSLGSYPLTKDENHEHNLNIKSQITNAALMWMH